MSPTGEKHNATWRLLLILEMRNSKPASGVSGIPAALASLRRAPTSPSLSSWEGVHIVGSDHGSIFVGFGERKDTLCAGETVDVLRRK